MKTSFQPGRLCAVLLSAGLSSGFFTCQAHAMTLQDVYALKGSGKVAAELLWSASGAPKGDVVVSALAQPGQAHQLLADLSALGLAHGAAAGRLVTGRLPFSAVRHLDALASLHSLRPSHALFHAASDPGIGRQGFTISQGDTEMYAAAARTRFGVDGAGVKVGVLSDSYDCLGALNPSDPGPTAGNLIQSGDLPPDVQVLKEWKCSQGYDNDEGKSMLEVIHDLAPGASLAFHTAVNGEADMANGIRALADAGATVIVDDTVYLDEPVYQEGGPIADAVKDVVGRGVTYVAAAGNFGRQTYEAPFRPSGVTTTIPAQTETWTAYETNNGITQQVTEQAATPARTVELHDFDPGPGVDTCQKITLYDGGRIALALHWDQPYASIGGGPGASSDLDLFLMDENCQQVYQAPIPLGNPPADQLRAGLIGVAAANNLGSDSVETLVVFAPAPTTAFSSRTYGIAIGRAAGPAPDRFRITYASGAMHDHWPVFAINTLEHQNLSLETAEYTQDGPTIFGHADLPEVITVGAVRAQVQLGPPENGIAPDGSFFSNPTFIDTGAHQTEPFSALGGTEILFDGKGWDRRHQRSGRGQGAFRNRPHVPGRFRRPHPHPGTSKNPCHEKIASLSLPSSQR